MFKILAISGSARITSTNTALLNGIKNIAPADIHFDVFSDLTALPIFSPDLETPELPLPVNRFIKLINANDALILSSPEYVRAVPGGLKNAIDWLVSNEAIIDKPIALVHASHRGDDMLSSMRLILSTVSTNYFDDMFLRFSLMAMTSDEISVELNKRENRIEIQNFLEIFRDKSINLT